MSQQAALWRAVRLDHVWLILPLAFAFYYACSLPIVHSDFFYNLTNGRLMVEQRSLLTRDVLAYAPQTQPFFNQPWLTQLAYYVEFSIGGYPLVLLVHAVTVTAAYAVVRQLAQDLTGSIRWATLATVLAIVVGSTNLSVRPQAYSFLPFALTLLLLWRHAARGWQLLLIPPIMSVWVNLHGAFLLGLGLVGLALAAALLEALWPWGGLRRLWRQAVVRRLTLVLVLTFLAMLVNPYGPRILEYWFTATGDPIARTLNLEWRATTFQGLAGTLFFLSWLPVVALLALSRIRPRVFEALLLLAFALFGLVAVRNVVWWGFVMPPILVAVAARARVRSEVGELKRSEFPVLNLLLVAAMALVVSLGLPWLRASNPLLAPGLRTYLDAKHPTGMVEYLRREDARGHLFARMEWGGYLEWELWPQLTPLLDARVELRPQSVWLDYFGVLEGSARWQQALDRYDVDYVAVEYAAHPDLERELAASPSWRETYRDSLAALYARR